MLIGFILHRKRCSKWHLSACKKASHAINTIQNT